MEKNASKALVIILAIIALGVVWVKSKDCSDKGGVLVKTSLVMECVKIEVIE